MSTSLPEQAQARRRECLVAVRKARHLSQAEIANTFGVTTTTVSRWERGVVTPTRFHRSKLTRMFGLSAQELDLL